MAEPLVPLFETFPALENIPALVHGFTLRAHGVDVDAPRNEALARLGASHEAARIETGLGGLPLVTVEQVHGASIAVVDDAYHERNGVGCDGLVTNRRNVVLGIYVADCCAVFIADRDGRALGLVHSGKKGTELGIVSRAIEQMCAQYNLSPGNLVVQLSPCIRPPLYEVDFAEAILRSAREAGVKSVHDTGVCTGANVLRYFSYRVEKGRTGRMLAFAALKPQPAE